MRILHICTAFTPRQLAHNGGERRYWQNLASLATLGHEVHLVICGPKESMEPEVRRLACSVQWVGESTHEITRLQSWRALVNAKAAFTFYFPNLYGLRGRVSETASKVEPDLIFADGIASMSLAPADLPVIYSHHDFTYKILTVRARTKERKDRWPDQLRRCSLRRVELEFCGRADHIVCVSASEKKQLDPVAKAVTYIPIVGPTVYTQPKGPNERARIFLFGTAHNTALRHSMRHCRQYLYPLLQKWSQTMEWHQVGEPEVRDTDDWRWVQRNFQCHGFVRDLDSVFRLGDGVLMPYAEDTGFRTRFVTAAAYGVVNIGYEITFNCVPEFTNGIDCLMAKSSGDMADVLSRFNSDPKLRQSLGASARMLYEREFAFESQLPKYEQVLRCL